MTEKIEDILFQCIETIKAGKSDIDDCLKRYPSRREELEPLLNIAVNLHEPPDVRPSHEFKMRARTNLMNHIYSKGRVAEPSPVGPFAALKRISYPVRLRTATVAIAVVAALCGVGGGFAYASQDSLPGDNLYSVKLGTEQVRRLFTVDDVGEVALELEFANTRLLEMAAVMDRENGGLGIAVEGYEKNVSLALTNAEAVRNATEMSRALEMMASATSDHIGTLDSFEDAAPGNAGYDIRQASGIALRAHIRSLRGLALKNPVRAAEINLATIESRLNRARTKAELNHIDEAELALGQFEELNRLGEEISRIARGLGNGAGEVDELNARATAAHLAVLGDIYGKMPDETKGKVENAMTASVEAYGRALEGLQEEGVSGDIPEEPPIPEDIPGDVKGRILKQEPRSSGNGSSSSGDGSGGSGNGRH